jgi:hypothetical protein
MAEIRCPNCGRSNPDLLDVCQFCQTPLKPESVLRIGEKPTKKNTGELESILPDWLKDVRQQAKDAAEQEAAQSSQRSPQKDEPPDLLAGLASQAGSAEEEDVPDWLASINPTPKSTPPASPASGADSGSDFFAQSNQQESKPEPVNESSQEEAPSWIVGMREEATIPFEKDELSDWFVQASERPEDIVESEEEPGELGWRSNLDSHPTSTPKPPQEEEDLSWLHNLEAAAKQTGDLQAPKKDADWMADFETPSAPSQSAPSDSGTDLGWLDRLGGIEEPAHPAPGQSVAPGDDLGWLNTLGGISEAKPVDAAPNQPIQPPPFTPEEDLDWLNKLGGTQEPGQTAQPFSVPAETPSADEDLSWLNNLGKPSEPGPQAAPPAAEQHASQEDLSWLSDLGGAPEPLSTPPFMQADEEKVSPRHTAPLDKEAVDETEPDWLKRATESPSMPAPGDLSMDWFSSSGQAEREKTPPASPLESDIFSTPREPASLSNQDVDSLFSVDLPDWLSRPEETGTAESVSQQTESIPMDDNESLAPVDLPSWVQAMRPMEAVITETAPRVEDQPAETEGPLAGLHGVIPIAPVGSSRRPKPVSLTLQASDEQQASAVLLEQILGSETSPRALMSAPVVTSQQWLRWALSALFLLVLSAAILLRSQLMPVSANLPEEATDLANAVLAIPANSNVLVVIDYEPSLAGELESIGGPVLDQIVLLGQPRLSFISTSPNGAALAERLVSSTDLRQSGIEVLNLGYLPGGPAGVLGFMEAPSAIVPSAGVSSFSEYAALVVLTDQAESGRVWIEQLQSQKQLDISLANKPLLMIASAQAGPLLQPYVSSGQVTGMISGLSAGARYATVNNNRLGIARSYWDTFGIGLMLAVALIIVGSLWSLYTGMRARRANAEPG